MKKPSTSPNSSDAELAGSIENPRWVHGRNCVYTDGSVAEYRVAIKTSAGWKPYGHFNDLATATYIANIAILAEHCEEKYQLNTEIGEKNKHELNLWRQNPGNLDLEKLAGERYKDVRADLQALREQERIEAEKAVLKFQQRHETRELDYKNRIAAYDIERTNRITQKNEEIISLSGPELVAFLKTTDPFDPHYKVAVEEARRRLKKSPISSAT